jgi:hypothetical protein
MRKVAILALAALLAGPGLAAEKPAGKESAAKKGRPGTNVDMPFLMAPLTGPDNKLTGYAYISTRLTAASDVFAVAVRDKLPFIQDAFVRDVNAAAVTVPGDPEKVDIAGVEARLLADARKVMGVDKVRLMTVCTVQIAELHPLRTPALYTPPEEKAPGAPPPKNPVKSRCES